MWKIGIFTSDVKMLGHVLPISMWSLLTCAGHLADAVALHISREEMRVMNDAYRRGQFGLADLGVGYALRVSRLLVPIFPHLL